MKKLLSSDYDGTLYSKDYELSVNLPYIYEFIKQGHIFLLNTGRSFHSIKKEIDKYNIPYNYLGCNDGNILFDSDDNVICCSNISNDIVTELELFAKRNHAHGFRVYRHKKQNMEVGITIRETGINFFSYLNELCLIHNLQYKTFRDANLIYVFIGLKIIDKTIPIHKVSTLEKINKCDIFTIGDHINDIEMIREFNGYVVPNSHYEAIKASSNGSIMVKELIKKIME